MDVDALRLMQNNGLIYALSALSGIEGFMAVCLIPML